MTELFRYIPRTQRVEWGPTVQHLTVYDAKIINPQDKLPEGELKTEAALVRKVADAAKAGLIDAVIHEEVELETWGLPSMDGEQGRFYGAPISKITGPAETNRVVSGPDGAEAYTRLFMESKTDLRFLELQKVTGAYQGKEKPRNFNQMLDAFFLWCAEYEKCDYFLTLDFRLIRMVISSPKAPKGVKMAKPSEILKAIEQSRWR